MENRRCLLLLCQGRRRRGGGKSLLRRSLFLLLLPPFFIHPFSSKSSRPKWPLACLMRQRERGSERGGGGKRREEASGGATRRGERKGLFCRESARFDHREENFLPKNLFRLYFCLFTRMGGFLPFRSTVGERGKEAGDSFVSELFLSRRPTSIPRSGRPHSGVSARMNV